MLKKLISKFKFEGDIVLECARGKAGGEVRWAKRNFNFVLKQLGVI